MNHLRPGKSTTLAESRLGDAISAKPFAKWKHPWFTTPQWLSSSAQWAATVRPGFVNEQTPVVSLTVAQQEAAGNNPFGNNPLSGEPFFSADVFAKTPQEQIPEQTLALPLYLDPVIPLDFYSLGFDGAATRAVPQFFLNRGVASAPQQPSIDDQLAGVANPAQTPPENLRLLRACDLWVHQPRSALTSSVQILGDLLLGTGNVIQQLGVRSAAPSDALKLLQGQFTPAAGGNIDPLAGDYEEPNFDEILVSTVYLLSPPKTPIGSEPDGSWTPYVRHNLFWNLQWAQPELRQTALDSGFSYLPPLAGGAAQLVIGGLIASLNDATRNTLNILTSHSLAGSFWTATGGGSDATLPSAIANLPSATTGPDRKQNAAAKAAQDAAQRRAQKLEPDFPYNAQRFPTSFLTAA
jgi:hypothetical protein